MSSLLIFSIESQSSVIVKFPKFLPPSEYIALQKVKKRSQLTAELLANHPFKFFPLTCPNDIENIQHAGFYHGKSLRKINWDLWENDKSALWNFKWIGQVHEAANSHPQIFHSITTKPNTKSFFAVCFSGNTIPVPDFSFVGNITSVTPDGLFDGMERILAPINKRIRISFVIYLENIENVFDTFEQNKKHHEQIIHQKKLSQKQLEQQDKEHQEQLKYQQKHHDASIKQQKSVLNWTRWAAIISFLGVLAVGAGVWSNMQNSSKSPVAYKCQLSEDTVICQPINIK